MSVAQTAKARAHLQAKTRARSSDIVALCWPFGRTVRTLARVLGVSERTVRRHLKKLEAAGEVRRRGSRWIATSEAPVVTSDECLSP